MAALLLSPAVLVADAKWLEPTWLKVRRLRLGTGKPSWRLVYFTDLHHKGDRACALAVVKTINSLSPDVVCFTGDLIEDVKFLAEALESESRHRMVPRAHPVQLPAGNHCDRNLTSRQNPFPL